MTMIETTLEESKDMHYAFNTKYYTDSHVRICPSRNSLCLVFLN